MHLRATLQGQVRRHLVSRLSARSPVSAATDQDSQQKAEQQELAGMECLTSSAMSPDCSSSSSSSSGEPSSPTSISSPDYLAQLLKDRTQMQAFSNVFMHLGRILEDEIARVREGILQQQVVNREPVMLPEPSGPAVSLSEKIFIPVKEHPEFNFVGRILGPRGMTTKQIEQNTGCKIMIRGRGSMRDRKKEEMNRGKPNWEHLSEDLHVLITVEDAQNCATVRLRKAAAEVRKLLVPLPESEDDLKKLQLMELAVMNGTYRGIEGNIVPFVAAAVSQNAMLLSGPVPPPPPALAVNPGSHLVHAPPTSSLPSFDVAGPGGAPIILAPRLSVPPPPPPASLPPPPAVMPQPPLVSFGDVPPAPLFVHFDPFLASQHQQPVTPALHHHATVASPTIHQPTMPNIAYVS